MRRILVTGGAGFIGSNFIRFWIARHPEDRITNLDKLTYAGNLENLKDMERFLQYKFVRGDICDRDLVQTSLQAEKIDTVVHFAAESHVDRSILDPEDFIRTNVHGTFTLLEAARICWLAQAPPTVRNPRFLHVSTDEVYGSLVLDAPSFSENAPYRPNSPYAASKAAADHLVRAYHHTYGLPAIITNCSNNYGPYQFPEKLIPLTIQQAMKGHPIPIYGVGANIRDWIHVEDHCRALEAALEHGRVGETYNIGGGNQWRNVDLVERICDLLDEKVSVGAPRRSLIRFVQDRPGHDLRYAMDISKITRELGWRPAETIQTGIAKTIDWYLEQQNWVERVMSEEYQNYFSAWYASRLAGAHDMKSSKS
jgi:dTDP-glucose 4,6-dehydratase